MCRRMSIHSAVRNCIDLGRWHQQVLVWITRPHQSWVAGQLYSGRRELPPIEEVFSPIRQLLVSTKIQGLLLQLWTYLAMLVIFAFCRHHSWAGVQLLSYLGGLHSTTHCYKTWSPGRRLSSKVHLHSSSSCISRVWCRQQNRITFKFWEATKGNNDSLLF